MQRKKCRQSRKKMLKRFILLLICGVLLLSGLKVFGTMQGFSVANRDIITFTKEPIADMPSLYSKNAILICPEDERILMEKNSTEKIYPASLTKMMTALLLVENLNRRDTVTVPQEIYAQIYASHASVAGFQY